MPHVPKPGYSRRTHGRVARESHDHGAYLAPTESAYSPDLVSQDVVDGVLGPGAIPPGTIDADGALIPGSLSVTPFADTIRPVAIVPSLPTLPDASYPQGSLVVLTSDGKVYRNVADVWSKAVDGLDILADTVTAGAIAAGAVGATEVATQALHVGHFMGGPSNLAPNPSFETLGGVTIDTDGADIPGWSIPTNCRASNLVTAVSGANSLRFKQPNPTIQIEATSEFLPVVAGRKYVESAWFRGQLANTGIARGRATVDWYDGTFALISSNNVALRDSGTSTTFTKASGTVTAPALAAWAKVNVECGSSSAVDDVIFVDDIEFYPVDLDVNHAGGGVQIASTGIILDGSLTSITFRDQYGSTALTGGGFGAAWEDYIHSGLLNGMFAQSNAAGNTINYWTLTDGTTWTWDVQTDSTAPGGFKLIASFGTGGGTGCTAESALAPITANAEYILLMRDVSAVSGGGGLTPTLAPDVEWFDKSQASISTTSGPSWQPTASATETLVAYFTPPLNAHYVKVKITCTAGDSNTEKFTIRGVSFLPVVQESGFMPYAYPLGATGSETSGVTTSLAVVAAGLGGQIAIPFVIQRPIKVYSLTIRSPDAASLRTAEWRLYRSNFNDLTTGGETTLSQATGVQGTFSFTPGAASNRTSALSTPTVVLPGSYLLVIRNTSTAQTFGLSSPTAGSMALNRVFLDTNRAALGTSLNVAPLTKSAVLPPICRLDGDGFNLGAAF